MKKVAPGIFVESSYAPYNLVLITSEVGGIAVDLPPNPVHCLNWLEQARAVVEPLRYVILTNGSMDRRLATAACDVPIVAAEGMLRVMQIYDDERRRRDYTELLAARYPDEAEAFDYLAPRKPTLALDDAATLRLGDRVLELEVVAGAAEGSLWIWLDEGELLIAGDTVIADGVPPMAEVPDSKAWLNAMAGLAHRTNVKKIVPGRGPASITRGEIEPQREVMRVMRRAARSIAHRGADSLGYARTSQDLGQTFFNPQGKPAVKEIRAGLERLVAELAEAEEAEGEGA